MGGTTQTFLVLAGTLVILLATTSDHFQKITTKNKGLNGYSMHPMEEDIPISLTQHWCFNSLGNVPLTSISSTDPSQSQNNTEFWECMTDVVNIIEAAPPSNNRNLRITHAYHVIGMNLKKVIGSRNDATWPEVAKWASNTVGYGIRQVSPLVVVEAWFPEAPGWLKLYVSRCLIWVSQVVPGLKSLSEEVSAALSLGNEVVFADLAPLFVTFGQHFANSMERDETEWDGFVDDLPKRQKFPTLIKAMRAYYEAKFTVCPKMKSQFIYLGTAYIVEREQEQLQPAIDGAFLDRLGLSELGTYIIGVLFFPNEVLALRMDVPVGLDGRMWAPGLESFENFPQREKMEEIIETYWAGYNVNSTMGSRANNWVRLPERIRFSLTMVRGRQHAKDNACKLFSDKQVELMSRGSQYLDESEMCVLNRDCCDNIL